MKKIWIYLIAVLALTFVLLTIHKSKDKELNQTITIGIDSEERNNLLSFWETYREATACRMDGKWEEAITKYKQALEMKPEHEDAIYYLGNMYLEMGADQKAEGEWLKLAKVNGESLRAHFQLGKLYMFTESEELFSLEKAESEFRKTIVINQDFIQPLIHLGEIFLYRADLDSSFRYFSAVLGTDPDNFESIILSAFIHWKQRNNQKALELYTRARDLPQKEVIAKSISQEGDTRGRKSMERQTRHSGFMSYVRNLNSIHGNAINSDMESMFTELDQILVNYINNK